MQRGRSTSIAPYDFDADLDFVYPVAFGPLVTNPDQLTPGRPPCMGIATPSIGVGAVNVRLDWQEYADLDLWVVDPCGQKIYYLERQKTCQGSTGQLDHDNKCSDFVMGRPENIFWGQNAPRGTYKVYVDYFADCAGAGAVDYTLRWWADGTANVQRGTVNTADHGVLVTQFTR